MHFLRSTYTHRKRISIVTHLFVIISLLVSTTNTAHTHDCACHTHVIMPSRTTQALYTLGKFGLITGGICLSSQLYATGMCAYTTHKYAHIRTLLVANGHNKKQCRRLLHEEILRQHYHMLQSYWITDPSYKNFPLMWYLNMVENSIYWLNIAAYVTFDVTGQEALNALLNDLLVIRDYIITDYDYIIETRHYI
jgi:hypothetical protein